jgi:hypothetical protein
MLLAIIFSNVICKLKFEFEKIGFARKLCPKWIPKIDPSTITTSALTETNGVAVATGKGVTVSTATQCLTDTFSVTGPGGSVPPVICGSNTGQHSKHDFLKAGFEPSTQF